jgi:hypothetical protein
VSDGLCYCHGRRKRLRGIYNSKTIGSVDSDDPLSLYDVNRINGTHVKNVEGALILVDDIVELDMNYD